MAGPLAELIAPPYDVLSPAQVAELAARNPYNVIRLEHPTVALSETSDPYDHAASLFSSWREAAVLKLDQAPAYYVHEQYFHEDGEDKKRTVIYGRLRLVEWSEGEVLPHEYTMSGPKEDRFELMKALSANISPLYLVYDDPQGHVGKLLNRAEEYGQVADTAIGDERHVLRPILDPVVVETIRSEFARLKLYIADGHHRYETALRYRDWRREHNEDAGGADYVMVGLTAGQDVGLSVHATHRLISSEPPADFEASLSAHFEISDVERARLETELAGSRIVFGLVERGRLRLLRPVDVESLAKKVAPGAAQVWAGLDVNILQRVILGEIVGLDPNEANQPGLSYVHSLEEAVAAVESGAAQVAFLLRPTSISDLFAISDLGLRMPQKSTYFYPKLPTGLLVNPLA